MQLGTHRCVILCCSSICHQLFTLIQIGSDHTMYHNIRKTYCPNLYKYCGTVAVRRDSQKSADYPSFDLEILTMPIAIALTQTNNSNKHGRCK